MSGTPGFWALVPAAGVGSRMGSTVPKQYLELAGQPVIAHTIARLKAFPEFHRILVALSDDDPYWEQTSCASDPLVQRVTGGRERCDSVLNGLRALEGDAAAEDWVLVHDAARPCLRVEDLALLIDRLTDHPVGGLLATPVHDTLKRAQENLEIQETVSRDGLWRAYTPQMFRYAKLLAAIEGALAEGQLVTDEASAMEQAGMRPLLVEGHSDNIKITTPEDLALAGFLLGLQGNSQGTGA